MKSGENGQTERIKIMKKQTDCDWKGKLKKRFRWSKLKWEWGRYSYIIHPVEGGKDKSWWEWADK